MKGKSMADFKQNNDLINEAAEKLVETIKNADFYKCMKCDGLIDMGEITIQFVADYRHSYYLGVRTKCFKCHQEYNYA